MPDFFFFLPDAINFQNHIFITDFIGVPKKFIGKTLVELKIRNKYGLEILMIKQQKDFLTDGNLEAEIITPDSEYKLKSTDTLVIFGSDEKIDNLRRIIES